MFAAKKFYELEKFLLFPAKFHQRTFQYMKGEEKSNHFHLVIAFPSIFATYVRKFDILFPAQIEKSAN